MTQDEIIHMAREAGFDDFAIGVRQENLERFAALVAAHEREACAKVCEGLHNGSLEEFGALVGEIYNENCAAAIRARGN